MRMSIRQLLRLRTALLVLFVSSTLTIAITSPAMAAKRTVPFGFFGVTDGSLTQLDIPPEGPSAADTTLQDQEGLMASSGVETVRITRDWATVEPSRGVYTWGTLDPFVLAAATHHLKILLNITGTPLWDSPKPTSPNEEWYPPKHSEDYANLMRAAVARYGPHGALWAETKGLVTPDPIMEWQVWNEESARFFWVPSPWAPSYTHLLKAAYLALHGAEKGARVVAGSLVGAPESPWDDMADLYRAGAKRYFDVISVHPFTNNPNSVSNSAQRVLEIIQKVRAVMDKHGDRRKPIIITEMTWTAALGHVPHAALLGFEVTPRGQAERLQAAYRLLAKERRKMNITQVYWFTWTSPYAADGAISNETFQFSGLTRISHGTIKPLPLLSAYSDVAAEYEGCRKSSSASKCR